MWCLDEWIHITSVIDAQKLALLVITSKQVKMSRPGPLRHRRSRRRHSGPLGIPMGEAQPSLASRSRFKLFRQPQQTKRVTFCE